MIAFLWMACALPASDVILSGQVLTAQDSGVGAPDILVSLRNAKTKPHGEVTTNENGMFEIEIPSSNVYHIALSGTDIQPTAFSGIVGQSDVAIPEDNLFVRSLAEVESLREEFSACPHAMNEGGIVEGVVQFTVQNSDDESYLVAPLTSVLVVDNQGVEYEACYFDDDGASVEDAENVGATGRFSVFGVPEGPLEIRFRQNIGGLSLDNYGFVYMPENGIAPFYPAFVDLAGQ